MSKLFAFEELDNDVVEGELEATPEVGEVADVQVDVMEEGGEIEEQATAIDEGVDAADQMEEVEALVEQAAEEGEGLDPVAAESLRIAVEAICARVGANPKSMYALYATENFQSASSRKANTRFALEGVSEFLKDLWKKIKAALTNLWAKVKAFWEKHLSSLGRTKKALESMKGKVASSSGKIEGTAYIENAPSYLSDALGGGELTVKSFKTLIAAHATLLDNASSVAEVAAEFNREASAGVSNIEKAIAAVTGGDKEAKGLVGGVDIKFIFEVDKEEGTVNFEVERTNADKKDKGGVALADKAGVKGLLDDVLKLINDTIKSKEKSVKLQESFNKYSSAIEKAINATVDGPEKAEEAKKLRKAMKIAYKINAKAPVIQNECVGLNIRLAKVALGYAGLCLKNYK